MTRLIKILPQFQNWFIKLEGFGWQLFLETLLTVGYECTRVHDFCLCLYVCMDRINRSRSALLLCLLKQPSTIHQLYEPYDTGRGSSAGSMSASQAAVPWSILLWKNNFPLPLIKEEQVVSYWRNNGHFLLVKYLRPACSVTVTCMLRNWPSQHDLNCLPLT